MANSLRLSVSPHIHSGKSTSKIMLDVIIALLPATVASVVIFGLRSLLVVASCVLACVAFEALFNLIIKKEQTISDLSAALTGLLIALNLPAETPVWQCVFGSFIAMVLVKGLFGGLGFNVVNPAITARVFMLVSFQALTIPSVPTIVDAVSSATPLAEAAEGAISATLPELLLGLRGGSIGETCSLALIAGGIYLICRHVITWHIPVAFVGSVYILSFIAEGFDATRALLLTLSGGLLIGAIFMATDYVTSPATAWGKIIFGVGAGLITFIIRKFGIYPEGVSFAILFMNILTPYIDSWTRHKVFGTGGNK